jgi:hypothetical protein
LTTPPTVLPRRPHTRLHRATPSGVFSKPGNAAAGRLHRHGLIWSSGVWTARPPPAPAPRLPPHPAHPSRGARERASFSTSGSAIFGVLNIPIRPGADLLNIADPRYFWWSGERVARGVLATLCTFRAVLARARRATAAPSSILTKHTYPLFGARRATAAPARPHLRPPLPSKHTKYARPHLRLPLSSKLRVRQVCSHARMQACRCWGPRLHARPSHSARRRPFERAEAAAFTRDALTWNISSSRARHERLENLVMAGN